MAVKISSRSRAALRDSADQPEEILGLRFQTSRRVEELLEEAAKLRSAGKQREAGDRLRSAERLQASVNGLVVDFAGPLSQD